MDDAYVDFSRAFTIISNSILLENLTVPSLNCCTVYWVKNCLAGPKKWWGMKLNPVSWSQAMFIYVFILLLRSIYFLEAAEYRSLRLLALYMRVSFMVQFTICFSLLSFKVHSLPFFPLFKTHNRNRKDIGKYIKV